MYIIKIKGKAKIPDHVQLRDENLMLIAYFRSDKPLKKPEKYGLEGKQDALKKIIDRIPFGKLEKISL